jgi:hypothetical protein
MIANLVAHVVSEDSTLTAMPFLIDLYVFATFRYHPETHMTGYTQGI